MRRSQHDKAMMPAKHSLFIHLNTAQLAEIIMINNLCHSRRLRGQITRNDIKTIWCSSFTVGEYHLAQITVAALGSKSTTDFIFSCRFLGIRGDRRDKLFTACLRFYLFTLPQELRLSCLQNPRLLIRLSLFSRAQRQHS